MTCFPLIFDGGQGSEFGQVLCVVTFGGVLFSAALTFFVVPAAFFLFERKRVENFDPDSPVPAAELSTRTEAVTIVGP